jgi:tryptophan synthase alpha chain
MSRIDELFRDLRSAGKKAFMPFITAGDPDLSFTAAVLKELDARGATMCEVGIPYSDPIADGPVIQDSYARVLDQHIQLDSILQTLGEVTPRIKAPVVTMVSYSIVYRRGLEKYVADAKAAGVAGAIVPDMLVEESDALAEVCRRENFSLIQLITPTTPRERARKIVEACTGFVYYVSVTGITGERTELPPSIIDNVGWLREQTDLPICIGFGISQPEHVRMLSPVADGLIVGSAIVKRVAQAGQQSRDDVLASVGQYAAELIAAM